MNKIRLLVILCAALIIANLFLIWTIKKPHGGPHKEPKLIIIEKLNFSPEQIVEYEKLIKVHRDSIDFYDKQIIELKNELYHGLTANPIPNPQSKISEISAIQSKIEGFHYAHFEEIKKLCNDSQLDAFDDLAKEIARIFAPHKPRR